MTDIMTVQGIEKYLNCDNIKIEVYDEVSSTNTLLKERAAMGEGEGHVIIASSQTHGRGRLGRSFFSPENTGIYMSVLLRPHGLFAERAVRTTTMAAVAACEAIEELSDRKPQIKWVNDIYIDGRKVSGILTEAAFNSDDGSVGYIILGIGINVYCPNGGFPDGIKSIAGAIYDMPHDDGRNRLAAEFINRFMAYYHDGENADYAEKYKEKCFVIGRDITVISPSGERNARAVDIDDECRLMVEYPDGTAERISTGEISIRISE